MRYGDGWMPIAARGNIDFKAKIAELNGMLADAGRDPVPVTMFGGAPKPEALETYAEAGAERVLFTLPPAGADEVLPRLKRYAELIRRFE